ncbi:MAG TPA: biotin--[acetyl-CoA-carboxylase] ligase [Spirochaetota bacterium]|nr:biotin--[acetyl-CoA-carboxylase] ligase [Spirochaetota bacterium]
MSSDLDFFSRVIYLENVLSTNTFLKENDCVDRTLVYTFDQTQGRGRENRKWLNFKDKNLALSVLFRPNKKVLNFLWYIAVNSLALIKLLEEYGVKNSFIKWPNDIYIEDKKIAGILAESVWIGENVDKVIVGIGVNVNSTIDDVNSIDKKATSVLIETGNIIDLKDFTEKYISKLGEYFNIFLNEEKVEYIKREWLEKNNIIGKMVKWIFNGTEIFGTAIGIDGDGFLLLQTNNEVIKILSGDVVLI